MAEQVDLHLMPVELFQHFKLLAQPVAVEGAEAPNLEEGQVDPVAEPQVVQVVPEQVTLEVFHHQKEIQVELHPHLAEQVKVAAAEAAAQAAKVLLDNLLTLVSAEMVQQIQLQDHQ